MTIIIFLLVLAVLIFVHELGHFLAARAFGIRVDAFKIGFGPKIFHWKRGETEYGLNLIPFGGYVKIFGENPDDESVKGPDSARSFVNKPKWQQTVVLAAGVIFNFVFAWFLYVATFMGGVTATTSGFERYADQFMNERVMISHVSPGSPAEKAGIKMGDVLVVPAGSDPIAEFQQRVNENGPKPLTIEIKRAGNKDRILPTSIEVTPASGIVEGKYVIGIAMENVGDLKLPFLTAIVEGTHYTWEMMKGTAVGLGNFIATIFQGTAKFSDVSGPVGIAGIVGDAASMGITFLLMITALISINLGIINLVPFPALDGGRILFVIIEGIIRRPIPMKFSNIVNTIGFALLMILMIVVTYKDIAKLIK